MPNSFLNTITKHSFNADLNLSFADTLLNDLISNNADSSKASPFTFESESGRILIKWRAPGIPFLNKEIVFKLKYDSFHKTKHEGILTLKLDDFGKAKQFISMPFQGLINFIGKRIKEFDKMILLKGDNVIIDLYKLLPAVAPDLPMEFVKTMESLMIDFEPGMTKIKIQLDNK